MYGKTPVGVQPCTRVHAHGAAASQPIFSRAVQPSPQRKAPLIERRKRKVPAALSIDQILQQRQARNPNQACVLTAPPAHVRIAKAPAGPHYTLHRCVDVQTQEVFFYPEYTGPAGEEELHRVTWPDVVQISSPMARSGAETMRNAGYLPTGATPPADEKDGASEITAKPHAAEEAKQAGESNGQLSLIQRRKRKTPAPLNLDVLPPFKRRNAGQVCVLEAPATHVRLHSVQAGPHHVMHQCIDAHTEEVFFLPEYVGPKEEKEAHKVTWPQVINPVAKPAEYERDRAVQEALAPEAAEAQITTGQESPGDGPTLAPGAAEGALEGCETTAYLEARAREAERTGAIVDPLPEAGVEGAGEGAASADVIAADLTADAAPQLILQLPATSASSAAVGAGLLLPASSSSPLSTSSFRSTSAVAEDEAKTRSTQCAASVEALAGAARAATHSRAVNASPGTPCDVAVVTATLLHAKTITVR